MAYDDKEWKGRPDRSTPVNAAGLNDLEARIKAGFDDVEAGDVDSVNGQTGAVVLSADDVGAASADDLSDEVGARAAADAALDARVDAIEAGGPVNRIARFDPAAADGTVISAKTGQPVLAGSGSGSGSADAADVVFTPLPGVIAADNVQEAIEQVAIGGGTALASKADIESPTFTGDPKAPTPSASDDDTSIATTAFVKAAIASVAKYPMLPPVGQYGYESDVSGGNVGTVSGRLYLHPYFVGRQSGWDRLGINQQAGATTGTFRLGVYSSVGDLPGALLLDAGATPGAPIEAVTGFATKLATVSLSLAAGPVWLAFQWEGTGSPSWHGIQQRSAGSWANTSGPSVVANNGYYCANTGALPASLPALTLTNQMPWVYMRRSS